MCTADQARKDYTPSNKLINCFIEMIESRIEERTKSGKRKINIHFGFLDEYPNSVPKIISALELRGFYIEPYLSKKQNWLEIKW